MSTAYDLIATAAREVGYTESPPGSNKTKFAAEAGHLNGYAWCATFVVAMLRRCGINLPSESAYTPTMLNGFIANGMGKRGHAGIAVGDVVFFNWDGGTLPQHVGIVTFVAGDHIETIEGNTSPGTAGSQSNGGGVYKRTRPYSSVVGYGRPKYTEAPVPDAPPPNYKINPGPNGQLVAGITALCDASGKCTGYLILGADGGVFGFGPGAGYFGRVS